MNAATLAVAATALSLLLAGTAQAASFTVNSTADPGTGDCDATECTLREAVDRTNVNGSSEPDQITINAAGTIDLQSGGLGVTTPTSIVGPGPGALTVRRSPTAVASFHLIVLGGPSPAAVSLSGIGVTGADIGGIWMKFPSAVVTLTDVAVYGNQGGYGAGITNHATLTIIRSTIGDASAYGDNVASDHGGGIYNDGTLTISDTTIRGNTSAGGGGGITNDNTGTLTVTNSTISGNTASDFGGGIENGGATSLNSVTIAGNEANSDSSAFGSGGGTWNGDGTTTVKNTLYYGNIVANAAGASQCAGVPPHTSEGYNLRGSADSDCAGFNAAGDIIGGAFTLGALANNGGPTATHALPAGAAAVDAGSPAPAGSGGNACPATDQRGLYRGGVAGRCDIGAFELGATVSPPAGPAAVLPTVAHKKCKKKKGKKRASLAKKKCKKRKRRH